MNSPTFPGKYDIVPSTSSVVAEIFNNEFDITWHQSHKMNNPAQRVWSIVEKEQSEDDGTVSYIYNDEYFRCDNFTDTHNGKHILFAGCSETEGQGGNIEDAWGNILYNKIKENKQLSGYYSIGKAGYGWQKVISQLRIYISRYGKPDMLFVLLPNMGRSIEWSEEESVWHAKQEYPNFWPGGVPPFNEDMYISQQLPDKYKKVFLDFVISWRLFEDFCLASGIKMVWGTWQAIDNYNFDKLNLFDNFVPLYEDRMLENIDHYREGAKVTTRDMKKRDGHHGRLFHEYWADQMLKEADRRGFLND